MRDCMSTLAITQTEIEHCTTIADLHYDDMRMIIIAPAKRMCGLLASLYQKGTVPISLSLMYKSQGF